ncbi:hypothetical protein IQ07DRAFT_588275 [Pyrenochaeta sp. DS3sAY3a]|nr:hypothetical protein IQ07DRAFT_588275 [Pyrenochaeta sp. DS3sAY3a]
MAFLLSVPLFFGLLGVACITGILYFKLVHKEPLTGLPTHDHISNEKLEFDTNNLPTTGPVPPSICAIDHATMNRSEWVERLHNYFAYYRYKGEYNCLVINEQLEYMFNSEDVIAETIVEFNDLKHGMIPYRVVVFNVGKVINLGDGGYINWQFSGRHQRVGKSTVIFSKSD